MKDFFLRFFTWWNGATLNTLWYTRRHGEFVGEDEAGNRYYRSRGGKKDPALGFDRRWVIYNGLSEASRTPPGWNGWLHHTVDVPPSQERYEPRPWERPHMANPTGTAAQFAQGVDAAARPAPGGGRRLRSLEPGGLSGRLHFARLSRQGSPMRRNARQTSERVRPRR